MYFSTDSDINSYALGTLTADRTTRHWFTLCFHMMFPPWTHPLSLPCWSRHPWYHTGLIILVVDGQLVFKCRWNCWEWAVGFFFSQHHSTHVLWLIWHPLLQRKSFHTVPYQQRTFNPVHKNNTWSNLSTKGPGYVQHCKTNHKNTAALQLYTD